MAVNNILSEVAKAACAMFRAAVQDNKLFLALGKAGEALKGLADVKFDGMKASQAVASAPGVSSPIRGGPSTGRG